MNRNRENRIYWNRGWSFFEEYTLALCEKETAGFPEGTEVELPHTAAVTPLHLSLIHISEPTRPY